MNTKIKIVIIVLSVIVLAETAVLIAKRNAAKPTPAASPTDTGVVVTDGTTTSTQASSTPTSTTSTALTSTPAKTTTTKPVAKPKTLSYSDLVKKYANYRFQFSNNCSTVAPSSFVLKKGLTFMVDNRENKPHVITFGTQKFSLKAYGYAVVTATPVGNQPVLCDGARRATVIVQN